MSDFLRLCILKVSDCNRNHWYFTAIVLPAYAKYMARARFTEVTSAIDGVKKQVELCIFDLGQTSFAASAQITPATVGGKTCQNGAAADYATKYVATIEVTVGVIKATAIAGNGLNSATYTIQTFNGAADNSVIDCKRDDANSDGITKELC